MGRATLVLALVAGGSVVTASCSSASGGHERQSSNGEIGPGAEPSRLGDGAVSGKMTKAEYEAAVRQMENCLAQSHVELVNAGWDPIDHEGMILGYKAPGLSEEKTLQVVRTCRGAYLDAAEERFKQDNKSYMAPELMRAVQTCLTDKGIAVTGREENPEDLIRVVPRERTKDLLECVHRNGKAIYPTLPITFP